MIAEEGEEDRGWQGGRGDTGGRKERDGRGWGKKDGNLDSYRFQLYKNYVIYKLYYNRTHKRKLYNPIFSSNSCYMIIVKGDKDHIDEYLIKFD